MKNLIEEIHELKDYENYDYDQAITDVEILLDQYNIITAPKSIKLSEIVERLKETILGTNHKVCIRHHYKEIIIYNKNSISSFIEDICNINSTGKIVWINETYLLESCKWLYTLWIAGTEIIDDLECDK